MRPDGWASHRRGGEPGRAVGWGSREDLTASAKSPWILRPRPRPEARLRLFCFPYAGGGASAFRGWPPGLPAEIETLAVQPPGREGRFREAAHRSLPELVAATAE